MTGRPVVDDGRIATDGGGRPIVEGDHVKVTGTDKPPATPAKRTTRKRTSRKK